MGPHAERHSGRPVGQTGRDQERKDIPRNTHTPENKSGIAMLKAAKLASERVPESQKDANRHRRILGHSQIPTHLFHRNGLGTYCVQTVFALTELMVW